MKGNLLLRWELIRSFAELQILTRASYFALITIPIVAGCWSSIRSILVQYDRSAWMVRDSIHSTKSALSKLTRLGNESEGAANQSGGSSTVFERGHSLPRVWGFAYFAALFLVVGHSVYQIFTPKEVQTYRRIEYVTVERDLRSRQRATPEDIQEAANEADERYTTLSLNGHWGVRLTSLMLYSASLVCVIVVIWLQLCAVIGATLPGAPVE